MLARLSHLGGDPTMIPEYLRQRRPKILRDHELSDRHGRIQLAEESRVLDGSGRSGVMVRRLRRERARRHSALPGPDRR